jgi:hypothetical protein
MASPIGEATDWTGRGNCAKLDVERPRWTDHLGRHITPRGSGEGVYDQPEGIKEQPLGFPFLCYDT